MAVDSLYIKSRAALICKVAYDTSCDQLLEELLKRFPDGYPTSKFIEWVNTTDFLKIDRSIDVITKNKLKGYDNDYSDNETLWLYTFVVLENVLCLNNKFFEKLFFNCRISQGCDMGDGFYGYNNKLWILIENNELIVRACEEYKEAILPI